MIFGQDSILDHHYMPGWKDDLTGYSAAAICSDASYLWWKSANRNRLGSREVSDRLLMTGYNSDWQIIDVFSAQTRHQARLLFVF